MFQSMRKTIVIMCLSCYTQHSHQFAHQLIVNKNTRQQKSWLVFLLNIDQIFILQKWLQIQHGNITSHSCIVDTIRTNIQFSMSAGINLAHRYRSRPRGSLPAAGIAFGHRDLSRPRGLFRAVGIGPGSWDSSLGCRVTPGNGFCNLTLFCFYFFFELQD